MKKTFAFPWVVAGLATLTLANSEPPAPTLLPLPQKRVEGTGVFKLAPETRIYTDAASRATGEFLAAQLRQSTGYAFKVDPCTKSTSVSGAILITTAGAKASLGTEGYELCVTPKAVVIRAPEQAGCFYGVQTMLQLLPPSVFAAKPVKGVHWTMPCGRIEDRPRFKWRGVMLDVARHFFSKAEVEKVLDTMAMLKLNTFHWHLTDDQGWRIEIKKYPRLTAEGAWRQGVGFGLDPKSTTSYGPDGRYGGFYTQDDIREIVAYAAARHIVIVPEIEMPGHGMTALSIYPEFGCPNGRYEALEVLGVYPGLYCAGQDETFEFLENILAEVIQLFPGQYIHVGGDEAMKFFWEKCPKCQARIKAEGLKDEKELQSYFIRRIEKSISGKGRRLVGWSEILEGGLPPGATVMDWIGGAEEAAEAGHDVVMSPTTHCYFDYDYGRLPLKKVYSFEPIPANLPARLEFHILGTQGNVWTEQIPSLKQLEFMMYPRLLAIAEVTWSPKAARNWDGFIRRLQVQFQRFDQLGINYRHEAIDVLGEGKAKGPPDEPEHQ